jgi:hypothetical protein
MKSLTMGLGGLISGGMATYYFFCVHGFKHYRGQ